MADHVFDLRGVALHRCNVAIDHRIWHGRVNHSSVRVAGRSAGRGDWAASSQCAVSNQLQLLAKPNWFTLARCLVPFCNAYGLLADRNLGAGQHCE